MNCGEHELWYRVEAQKQAKGKDYDPSSHPRYLLPAIGVLQWYPLDL